MQYVVWLAGPDGELLSGTTVEAEGDLRFTVQVREYEEVDGLGELIDTCGLKLAKGEVLTFDPNAVLPATDAEHREMMGAI